MSLKGEKMKEEAKKATLLGILGNLILFILKFIAGFLYNSIAVISDAFNSLTDIVASVIVYISVKVSSKKADKGHPFGHHRAEPIAGLIVAIFTGILGFEVIKIAFTRLLTGEKPVISLVPVFVIGLWIIKAGYGIGKDNIGFLIGVAPSDELMNLVKKIALSVKGVNGIHD